MAVTLQQELDIFYQILREDQSDSGSYDPTFAIALINSAQQRICNGTVMNPFNGKVVKKGELPFLYKEVYYSQVKETTLSADVALGATTLPADTTDFPTASGERYLYIAGDIVTYTALSSTQFTGCSNVLFPFQSGTQISIAFAVPSDFASIIEVVYRNRFKLPAKDYNDMYEDLNSFKGTYYDLNTNQQLYSSPLRVGPFYTIKDGQYLITFNIGNTGDMIKLRYEKLPTTLSAVSDTVVIPNDIYAKNTIPYIAVGEMLYNRGEEKRAAEILNFALGQVKEMYDFYNKSMYESISGKPYGLPKGKLNI